jgi:hypothetical protein
MLVISDVTSSLDVTSRMLMYRYVGKSYMLDVGILMSMLMSILFVVNGCWLVYKTFLVEKTGVL